MSEKIPTGPNTHAVVEKILRRKVPKLPDNPLGQQIGRMLAEIAVELQDRIDEVTWHKMRSEALRGEIKTLAALIMARQTDKRIVVTRQELDALPEDIEVHVETPEEGVRIYTLRRSTEVAVKAILNG